MSVNQLIQLAELGAHDVMLAINDHLRRVNHGATALPGIGALTQGVIWVCKFVFPPNVVPIVHMQRQSDHVIAFDQIMHDSVCWWAGGASL